MIIIQTLIHFGPCPYGNNERGHRVGEKRRTRTVVLVHLSFFRALQQKKNQEKERKIIFELLNKQNKLK